MPGKLTKFHCDVIFEQNTVQEVEKVSPHSQFVQFDKRMPLPARRPL